MTDFGDLLAGRRLVVILRGMDAGAALPVAEAVWDSGAGIVEVPIQTPAAVETLRVLAARGRERGEPVGAGTVLTADHVTTAADAGAAFTVAPGFSSRILHLAADAGLAHLPGVATASEVDQALALGCTWLKAFPAAQLGDGWFGAMRGPFPEARFVATGGVTPESAVATLAAGADALGVGGSVADPESFARLLAAIGGAR